MCHKKKKNARFHFFSKIIYHYQRKIDTIPFFHMDIWKVIIDDKTIDGGLALFYLVQNSLSYLKD